MLSYCTKSDVKDLTGVQSKHWFKNETNKEQALNNMLDKWINISSEVISKYCNREWDNVEKLGSNLPSSIRLATSISVSNIIAFSQTRRDTPIIQKDNWNFTIGEAGILSDDVKELIDPFMKEKESKQMDVFCISGE